MTLTSKIHLFSNFQTQISAGSKNESSFPKQEAASENQKLPKNSRKLPKTAQSITGDRNLHGAVWNGLMMFHYIFQSFSVYPVHHLNSKSNEQMAPDILTPHS